MAEEKPKPPRPEPRPLSLSLPGPAPIARYGPSDFDGTDHGNATAFRIATLEARVAELAKLEQRISELEKAEATERGRREERDRQSSTLDRAGAQQERNDSREHREWGKPWTVIGTVLGVLAFLISCYVAFVKK